MSGEVTLDFVAANIAEQISEGEGVWRSCTGCHETDEGHPLGAYSKALQCHIGLGCGECGGIGAVWDNADYAEMASFVKDDEPETEPVVDLVQIYAGDSALVVACDGDSVTSFGPMGDDLMAVYRRLEMAPILAHALRQMLPVYIGFRNMFYAGIEIDSSGVPIRPDQRAKLTKIDTPIQLAQEALDRLEAMVGDDTSDTEPGSSVRTCRQCGCTDDDCSACVERTGMPCHWVEADLCSGCSSHEREKEEGCHG